MLSFDPVVMKFAASNPPLVKVKSYGYHLRRIPDGTYTKDEIKTLRDDDARHFKLMEEHVIANFLPDGERPEGVPDYEETLRRAKRSEDDPKRT